MKAKIYCGNNYANRDVRNGSKIVGTKYQCLKKGVGVGLHMPNDKDYDEEYIPIDTRKIYCGEAPRLPAGYDLVGSNGMCFAKGVGIGRKLKAKRKEEEKGE